MHSTESFFHPVAKFVESFLPVECLILSSEKLIINLDHLHLSTLLYFLLLQLKVVHLCTLVLLLGGQHLGHLDFLIFTFLKRLLYTSILFGHILYATKTIVGILVKVLSHMASFMFGRECCLE